jgi:DNA-binding GntR family transcriptional regulator
VNNLEEIVNNLQRLVHCAPALGTIAGVPMATKRTTRRTAGEAEIYEAVLAALLDGRLPAGTPLREHRLAAMFGTTRGRARKVLMRLGHEGRLELIPNRGAFVPTPTLADARRVFAARRVLEAGIVATLAQGVARSDLARLRKHLDAERRAAAAGRRHDSVKLSAAFHTLLAEIVGSEAIAESLDRLLLPAQLLVSLYEPASLSHCAPTEHEQVVDALAAGDVKRAVAVMTAHLAAIEGRLAVPRERSAAIDLPAALGLGRPASRSR